MRGGSDHLGGPHGPRRRASGHRRSGSRPLKLLVGRRTALGIKGIAAAFGLDLETFEEVHEPWLERSGLIERTPTMIHPPRPRSHS